jgi:hypothetical protein
MDDADAKQRATDALLAKFLSGRDLQRVEKLPAPVYGFDPAGWLLFFFDTGRRATGEGEYVAVKRETGEVRFLGNLSE